MFRALVVDDKEVFLIDIKRMKVWEEITGFSIVDTASNGQEALALLSDRNYDLVITEICMPLLDGLQLLREIKNNNLCPCVVLWSERTEFIYARQGIVLGAFDYIVKPAAEEDILELLIRARSYLEVMNNKGSIQGDFTIDDKSEWFYPSSEEKAIINHFKTNDISAVQLFDNTLDYVYNLMPNRIIKADAIIKKLYHNIISAVYEEFKWLNNFINVNSFSQIDYICESNANAYREYYNRKISYLITFIIKYQPCSSDDRLKSICNYILNHVEDDLRLKILSEKFYINNTYLSNTFTIKAGIHFNDYITMVKMARAEYLFTNTNLKTYEVGCQIGYKDMNYFSKQFKKYYGYTPLEYRNNIYMDFQI